MPPLSTQHRDLSDACQTRFEEGSLCTRLLFKIKSCSEKSKLKQFSKKPPKAGYQCIKQKSEWVVDLPKGGCLEREFSPQFGPRREHLPWRSEKACMQVM